MEKLFYRRFLADALMTGNVATVAWMRNDFDCVVVGTFAVVTPPLSETTDSRKWKAAD